MAEYEAQAYANLEKFKVSHQFYSSPLPRQ